MAFARTDDQRLQIGFQVPSDDVMAVTGYCAALLAIEWGVYAAQSRA